MCACSCLLPVYVSFLPSPACPTMSLPLPNAPSPSSLEHFGAQAPALNAVHVLFFSHLSLLAPCVFMHLRMHIFYFSTFAPRLCSSSASGARLFRSSDHTSSFPCTCTRLESLRTHWFSYSSRAFVGLTGRCTRTRIRGRSIVGSSRIRFAFASGQSIRRLAPFSCIPSTETSCSEISFAFLSLANKS